MTEFKVGDRVRHKTIDEADIGVVQEVMPTGHVVVKYRSSYGLCTDPPEDLVLLEQPVINTPEAETFGPLQEKTEAGSKFDGGKARIDLIAPEMLIGTAEILDFGAKKYGERNWEQGMSWSRPFAALMRHMWAWWAGQELDEETGKSHLFHAACCLMFLIAFEARKTGKDDRAKVSI
jgi:hypothetical protein